MQRMVLGLALMAALVFTVAPASAAPVLQSGNVFHVMLCPGPVAPGYARCHAHVVTDRSGRFLAQPAGRTILPAGYGPTQLRSAYAVTGTGSTATVIALVEAYGYPNASADLAVYRAEYGLPACTTANGCLTIYNEAGVKGNYPAFDAGWAGETALDLDMVSAMCPNCKIVLIQATTNSYGNLATAENVAAALRPHAITNSYGGSEIGTTGLETAYNHPGIAITVSTGDIGYGAEFPATSPHVTAVGGTTLTQSAGGRGWSEVAWSEGGSGCSTVYGKPAWQHDPLCTRRMEADVSAVADPATGVAVYGPVTAKTSEWLVYGGTSVASPLVAGIYGVNAGAANYGSNPYSNTKALNDITRGSNGSCGGTYFCNAGTGYDGPTGLGTPIGITDF